MNQYELDVVARRVAKRLIADLRGGKITKIDISTIREAIRLEGPVPSPGQLDSNYLEERTTRYVVEAA